jgi:hypothetical protein
MHLKVFLKLKKTLKPSLLGKKTPQKKQKKTKPPPIKKTGLGLFKKTWVFSNPGWNKLDSGIRDGKNSDQGSGINIPDPQHWKSILRIRFLQMR